MTNFPAGYMLVNGIAMHVAKVRRHTSDINRFRRLAPLAESLSQHEPFSDDWTVCIDEALRADPSITLPDLEATLRELGDIAEFCAAELKARRAAR